MARKKHVTAQVIGGPVIGTEIIDARTFFTRLRGLLGTDVLEVGQGCYLDPCPSIHCKGMKYPIDVVYLADPAGDGGQEVIAVERCEPGSFGSRFHGVRSVLEIPAGEAERLGIVEGCIVKVE